MRDTCTFHPKHFRPSKHAEHVYDEYNIKYFNHELPVVHIGFYSKKKMTNSYAWTIKTHGAKYPSHILLNPYFEEWSDTIHQNILHEMIHVKLLNKFSHGPKFKKEMRRLLLAGAFDDLL